MVKLFEISAILLYTTVINSSAIAKIKVVSHWLGSILIVQMIFLTSDYNGLINQRPHTIVHH